MNAALSPVEQIQHELPDLDWITDDNRVTRLSQDFSWFSPVLKRDLAGKRAAAVAKPRSEDEIRRLVSACARRKVPITVRGGGTGNYGQAVPLHGGILLDMSGYNAFLWARPGVGRAQAGIKLGEFDRAARPSGWELRAIPSTFKSATLGGLFGGGFGGAGSITYGPLAAPGNVLGVRAMTIEAEPQIVELRGAEAMRMHHLWGTNGLVLEIEVGLAPALPWAETIVVFDDFDQALAFGDAVAHATGIVKKEICFLADPIPAYMHTLADHLPNGKHAILLLVAEYCRETTLEMAAQHGGQVTYDKSADEAAASGRTLVEYGWNHTTLHALKVDKGLTYLQSSFTPGEHLEQVSRMEKLFKGEVLMHAEFLRNGAGLTTCTALQLVRYTTEERLREIIAIYRANGVRINDPHTFIIEEGKAGGDLDPEIVATKRRFDPLGLLNPGKMRAWPYEG
ncbi:MAG: FAD-binding oxidoreductase [Burkholderiaceae bacterium]|nr:FAD-binding oxidoreductase [Burkholderiaceae bacterium]